MAVQRQHALFVNAKLTRHKSKLTNVVIVCYTAVFSVVTPRSIA